jgi:hypothetical protein
MNESPLSSPKMDENTLLSSNMDRKNTPEEIKKFLTSLTHEDFEALEAKTQRAILDVCYRKCSGKLHFRVLELFGSVKHLELSHSTASLFVGPDPPTSSRRLLAMGVTTVKVLSPKKLSNYREEFDKTLQGFPEYKPDTQVYVPNGFAALGNPSSFHNPLVRKLRKKAYPVMRQLLKRAKVVPESFYLQALFDRMLYRQPGQKPTPESWHRDVTDNKFSQEGQIIYGGWINLDDTEQSFSCIPGSHLGVTPLSLLTPTDGKKVEKKGFQTITPEDAKEISKYKREFKVPPGHMIVFPQYILHEVSPSKIRKNMYRLFTGWRISPSRDMICDESVFEDQAVPKLPGGEIPGMYANNHIQYYVTKPFNITDKIKMDVREWSEKTFKDRVLVERNFKVAGKVRIVPKNMLSLKEMKLKRYPKYEEEEIEIYRGVRLDE